MYRQRDHRHGALRYASRTEDRQGAPVVPGVFVELLLCSTAGLSSLRCHPGSRRRSRSPPAARSPLRLHDAWLNLGGRWLEHSRLRDHWAAQLGGEVDDSLTTDVVQSEYSTTGQKVIASLLVVEVRDWLEELRAHLAIHPRSQPSLRHLPESSTPSADRGPVRSCADRQR